MSLQPARAGVSEPPCHRPPARRSIALGRMAGEGEEDVVERRLVHLDVVDARSPAVVERAHDRRREAWSAVHGRAQPAAVVADVHRRR